MGAHTSVDDEVTPDRLPVYRPSTRRTLTVLLLLAIPLAAGSYFLIGRWKAQRNREIKKQLVLATEQLRHDSYESYKRACAAAESSARCRRETGLPLSERSVSPTYEPP